MHDGGSEDDFKNEEAGARGQGDGKRGGAPRETRSAMEGFGEQAHFDAELGDARLKIKVAAGIGEVGEGARKWAGSGLDDRRGEGAEKADGEEGELETGVEELLGIEEQKAERDRGQKVHDTPFAVEIAADHIQRESSGGAHAGRLPAGDQGVEPGGEHGK